MLILGDAQRDARVDLGHIVVAVRVWELRRHRGERSEEGEEGGAAGEEGGGGGEGARRDKPSTPRRHTDGNTRACKERDESLHTKRHT